jgi:tetratricopeptide (TPR) repeat protein
LVLLAAHHESHLLAIIGIAEVHTEQADYEEAEELGREGLKIADELGNKGKTVVARAIDLLGNIQYDIGNVQQALGYYEQALSIDKAVYGDRHPNVARDLNNIGLAWDALGGAEESARILRAGSFHR